MKTKYEQHAELVCEYIRNHREQPFMKHERVELLEMLCCCEDPELRRLGAREQDAFCSLQHGYSLNAESV